MSDKSDLPLVIIGLGAAYLIITSITTPAAAVGQAAAEWWNDVFGGAPQPDDLADSAFPGRIVPTPEGFLPSNITWDLVDSDGREIAVGLPFGYTPETWCAEYPEMDFCRIVRGEPIVDVERPSFPPYPIECSAVYECCYNVDRQCMGSSPAHRHERQACNALVPGCGIVGQSQAIAIMPEYIAWRNWVPYEPVTSTRLPPPPEDEWYEVVWSWLAGLWEGALEWATWTNGYE